MNNTERNCDTCNDSYYMTEKNPSGGKKLVQLQHCRLQFPRLHPSDVTGGLGQGLLPPLDPYHRERK